MISQF
jgi:outer membrane immunogenic protein